MDRTWLEDKAAFQAKLATIFGFDLQDSYDAWKIGGKQLYMTKKRCQEWMEALRKVRRLFPSHGIK